MSQGKGGSSGCPLLPHHQALLDASAISAEVADARGYRSASEKRELNGLFGPVQQRVPGLLIPLFDVYGEQRSYQLRPDEPRIGKDGKAIKYETPRGLKMMLDCPPATLEHVRDPKVTLWVTEGIRKVDSLASAGLRGIALLGVDCWRGTNEMGGKTTLEDWFGVALNGRRVVICFDSDAFEKPEVHGATERLGRWLESRGAELSFAYLPHADDGSKVGVDDFLASHTKDDLLGRIERTWHPLPHQTIRAEPKSDAPLVPTGQLITEVAAVLDRYVVLPSRAAVLAVALYVLHTWTALEVAEATPYLVIQSPTKRAGKSRLEEVLELLVRRPWRIAATSESALFRKIDRDRPTLLLDEVDALFGRSAEANEGVRGILNAGNRAGASVARSVGDAKSMEVVDFSVYCCKILAGIGTSRWPDTVIDRSVVVQMRRRKPTEPVERFRHKTARAETEGLRARLARWAEDQAAALLDTEPQLPAELDDRQAEGWEPLLAIGELADRDGGEGWADRARSAALKLSAAREPDEDAHGVVALAAIRAIIGDADAIHTSTIVEALNGNEAWPFSDYRKGAGLNARGLTKLLRPFAISSQNVRVDERQAKGFRAAQFADAWARYCDKPRGDASNPSQRPNPNSDGGFGDFSIRPTDPSGTDRESPESPANTGDGTDGRIETPNPGLGTQNGALGRDEEAAIDALVRNYFAAAKEGRT